VVGEHEDIVNGGTYFTVQFGEDRLFRGTFSKDQLCEVEEGVENDES
jgi:hypothetical protein